MTKLYYTCPIEAAYMADKFGVEFTQFYAKEKDGSWTKYDTNVIQCNAASPIESLRTAQTYYVHPDSLHIFEPQDNDVGFTDDGLPAVFSDGGWRYISNMDSWEVHETARVEIIWRGVSFIAPKEE